MESLREFGEILSRSEEEEGSQGVLKRRDRYAGLEKTGMPVSRPVSAEKAIKPVQARN